MPQWHILDSFSEKSRDSILHQLKLDPEALTIASGITSPVSYTHPCIHQSGPLSLPLSGSLPLFPWGLLLWWCLPQASCPCVMARWSPSTSSCSGSWLLTMSLFPKVPAKFLGVVSWNETRSHQRLLLVSSRRRNGLISQARPDPFAHPGSRKEGRPG